MQKRASGPCLRGGERRGEHEAFEGIVGRYEKPAEAAFDAPSIQFVLAHELQSSGPKVGQLHREEARDLTQQAFVKVFEKLDTYDCNRRFFSWMYRIAVNETLNYLKSHHSWEPLRGDYESPQRNAEDELVTADRDRELNRALLALEMKYRLVIIARHFLNLSYADAAEVLDLPEKTVKSRLFMARSRLREILEEQHA